MTNSWKHTFLALFAAGSGICVGCGDEEELNLPGYPETPVGIVIADAENASTVTVKATYRADGSLEFDGELTRTYVFSLSTPSPEDATFHVETIGSNIPEDRISISATELKVPAGAISAEVTVGLIGEDMSFMKDELDAMTYELGVRLTGVEGSRVTMPQSEAKVIVEKEAFSLQLFLIGEKGNNVEFERNYVNGEIINEETMNYTFRISLDRPAVEDVTVSFLSEGLPEGFADAVTVTPQSVMIPAGKSESEEIKWTCTDDFLLTNADKESFVLTLRAKVEKGEDHIVLKDENSMITFRISKTLNLVRMIDEIPSSWEMCGVRTSWTVQTNGTPNGAGYKLIDGNFYTDVYKYYGQFLIKVDMKQEYPVSGVVLRYYANLGSNAGDSVTVSISNDNSSWTELGSMENLKQVSPHVIEVLSSVSARYVRVEFGYKSGVVDVAEIEVYKKE